MNKKERKVKHPAVLRYMMKQLPMSSLESMSSTMYKGQRLASAIKKTLKQDKLDNLFDKEAIEK